MKRDEARIDTLLKAGKLEFKAQHFIDFTCIGPDRDGDRDGERCFVDFVDFVVQVTDKRGQVGFIFLEVDEHPTCFRKSVL